MILATYYLPQWHRRQRKPTQSNQNKYVKRRNDLKRQRRTSTIRESKPNATHRRCEPDRSHQESAISYFLNHIDDLSNFLTDSSFHTTCRTRPEEKLIENWNTAFAPRIELVMKVPVYSRMGRIKNTKISHQGEGQLTIKCGAGIKASVVTTLDMQKQILNPAELKKN